MANRNKRTKKRQPQQQRGTFGLAGWIFLVLEEDRLVAQGQVIASPSPTHHLVQFNTNPPYSRILSNEALQEGSLYPTPEAAQAFLTSYMAQYVPADVKAEDVPADANQELTAEQVELQDRADANGFTIEQQIAADLEAADLDTKAEALSDLGYDVVRGAEESSE